MLEVDVEMERAPVHFTHLHLHTYLLLYPHPASCLIGQICFHHASATAATSLSR